VRRRYWREAALRIVLGPAVIALLLEGAPREARAEVASGALAEAGTRACPAAADLSGGTDPGILLELALRCYDVERYATALAVLEHLDVHAPNPTVVFNLGAVHAALGHCTDAKRYYGRYLAETHSESGREEARQQLEILGDCPEPSSSAVSQPDRPSPPAPVPLASTPPVARLAMPSVGVEPPLATRESPNDMSPASFARSSDDNHASISRVATWMMFGGSAAFLLASGGFAYAAERRETRSPPSERGDVIAAAERAGRRYDTLAWACAGGALALASSGLLLLAFEPGEGTQLSVRTAHGRTMSVSLEHQF